MSACGTWACRSSFYGILDIFTQVSEKTTENSERLDREEGLGQHLPSIRFEYRTAQPVTRPKSIANRSIIDKYTDELHELKDLSQNETRC